MRDPEVANRGAYATAEPIDMIIPSDRTRSESYEFALQRQQTDPGLSKALEFRSLHKHSYRRRCVRDR